MTSKKWIYLVRFRKVENDKYYYRAFTSWSKCYKFKDSKDEVEYDNFKMDKMKLE